MRDTPHLALAVIAGLTACATQTSAQINLVPPLQPARGTANSDLRRVTVRPLPIPPVAESAPPQSFLLAARAAAEVGRDGEAQEALERAETRLLDFSMASTRPTAAVAGDQRAVRDVAAARRALAARNRVATIQAIDAALDALNAPVVAAQVSPPPGSPVAIRPPVPVPVPDQQSSEPTVTYALLPGHWKLDGAKYVWVKPDTRKRRVQSAALVQGRYVWKDGAYVWVPAHYER